MKYDWSLWFLSCLACCLMACSQRGKFVVEGATSLPGYARVWLVDREGVTLDSAKVRKGAFRLKLSRIEAEPSWATVRLQKGGDEESSFYIPVMLEDGRVMLSLGESIHLEGTPLNEAMQEFLNGVQACRNDCLRRVKAGEQIEVDEKGIVARFSSYYLQQITVHRHDALGHYIYHSYGSHLNREDALKAKELLNIKP